MIVAVVPALDEEACVADVVLGIRPHVDAVVVVDNGSRDATADVARDAGAIVVRQPERGYGAACLSGIDRARSLGAEWIVFLDADGSDDPDDAPRLLEPALRDEADLVLGVRTVVERGAMTSTQAFGNWLAPFLLRALFRAPFHDLSPFKIVRASTLDRMALRDRRHGFTIEMLLRAHTLGVRSREVDVRCRRRRAGASKVSGTVVGSARAGVKIIGSIARHALPMLRANGA